MPSTGPELMPGHALLVARVLWAALVIGQIMFGVIVAVLQQSGEIAPTPDLATPLFLVSLGMLVVFVPAGYFVRNQVYKSHWREHAVAPRGYVLANLILFVLLEAVSFAALLAVLVSGQWLPALAIALVSLGVQALNFPNGQAMVPREPAFPSSSRDR